MTKRILTLFVAQVLMCFLVSAQISKPVGAKQYQSLTGKVYIFTLFVDTSEGVWEDEERDYYFEELLKSQDWLQDQAVFYGQHLEFDNDYFFRNKDRVYSKYVDFRNSRILLNDALKQLKYKDFNDFLNQTRFDFKQNKLKILFFVKSKNRSHAYNYFSNSEVDIAIIYSNCNYGMVTDHYVVSHEMLHQFGAWDLYFGESQSREKAEKLLELYPNSIMINTYSNQERLEVDELTAWRVGWHNDFKEDYIEFTPVWADRTKETNSTTEKSIKFDLRGNKDKD